MDQKEKQIIVTSVTTIVIFACYSLYVYYKYIAGNPAILDDFRFWGKSFVIFIPVTIVAQIVIHIVFAIVNKIATNEIMDTLSDERDKLIDLKSMRIAHLIFTLGFLIAMASLAFGLRPYMLFVILFASGLVSSLVSEIAKFYFYRKGV